MITREGLPFILAAAAVTVLSVVLAASFSGWLLIAFAIVCGLVTVFMMLFFRDPPRQVTASPDALLAPADGRIVGIEEIPQHPHVGRPAVLVSIFLSILDVHINRAPATGRVDYVVYRPGRFLAAYRRRASDVNEQSEIGLTLTNGTRIVVKQIAGSIARRIVCRLRQGDTVTAGARIGMIRFGSRTDLLIPAGCALRVEVGDHVTGGLTVIGTLPPRLIQSSDETRTENVEL